MRNRESDPVRRPLRFVEIIERREKRRRVIQRIIILATLFSLLAGIVYGHSSLIVNQVDCQFEGENCETELNKYASTLTGKSMLSWLKVSHPYLLSKTERVWPSGVRVIFHKPLILLSFTTSSPERPSYSLTESGFITPFLDGMTMIPVQDLMLEKKNHGEKVNDRQRSFYKELVLALKQYPNLPISSIQIISEDLVELFLDMNTKIEASETNIGNQLASLQAILLSPTIQREGKTIDLRFQNPVLK